MDKVRPNAIGYYNSGNDGWDAHHEIQYSCPNCNKKINVNDIACDTCGTFFDWSKHAKIRVVREIIWE